MAFRPDYDKMEENKGGGGEKETCIIPEKGQPAQCIMYAELGKHVRHFKGQPKAPELAVVMTFEFAKAPHTGSYPLSWSCTKEFKKGEFFDWVGISDKLLNNELSASFAAKTSYMKNLTALNNACDKDLYALEDAVGELFKFHVLHAKTSEGKLVANMSITGRSSKSGILKSVDNVIMRDPDDPDVIFKDYSKDYPLRDKDKCLIFSWENPTEEAWKALKPWHKSMAKRAVDFPGSALEDLLLGNPDLDIDGADEDKSETNPNDKPGTDTGSAPAEGQRPASKLGGNSDAGGL